MLVYICYIHFIIDYMWAFFLSPSAVHLHLANLGILIRPWLWQEFLWCVVQFWITRLLSQQYALVFILSFGCYVTHWAIHRTNWGTGEGVSRAEGKNYKGLPAVHAVSNKRPHYTYIYLLIGKSCSETARKISQNDNHFSN